ncbi:hypothetical protein F4814DRAFT_360416 [Daldinia grandis]|nr:hypothetical protein F4814DRAFT_360416 [Daldinia grandis]
MLSSPRTPSPQPWLDSELDTLSARAGQQQCLAPAVAYELNDEHYLQLTSLSGPELIRGHNSGPPKPCSPSPFDSPTSNHKSSAAARDSVQLEQLMTDTYMTRFPPDCRLSAHGTPTRSARKAQDDEEEDSSSGYGDSPPRIRYPRDNDPVRRFLAAEFYKMADRPASHDTASGSASPLGFRFVSPTSCSRKRTTSTSEGQYTAFDTIIDSDNVDQTNADQTNTKLTPKMDEWKPFGNISTSSGRPTKRARRLDTYPDSENFMGYQEDPDWNNPTMGQDN